MSIKISKHAINRYRERLFEYSASDEEIIQMLTNIAVKGKKVCDKPDYHNQCIEIAYKGISIVVVQDRQGQVVITCLGERGYRNWVKAKGMCSFLSQSILCSNYIIDYKENWDRVNKIQYFDDKSFWKPKKAY
jgi:hypothetical protein